MRSEYFNKLWPENVKQRYLLKLEFIDNIDPYCLTRSSPFFIDPNELPEVSDLDIYAYFLSSHSSYTFEKFKAYKALHAPKYINAGFVENPLTFKVNGDYCVIVARVNINY